MAENQQYHSNEINPGVPSHTQFDPTIAQMDALSHQDHTGQMRTAPGNMQAYSGATEQQHTDLNTANMSNIAAGQQTDIPGAFHVDSDDEDDDVAEVMHMLDCAPHDDDHDGDNAHNGQEMPLVDHHAQVARGHEGNEAYGGDDMEMDANSDMDLDHDAAQYHHDLHDNHEQQQQQEEEGEDMVDPFEAVSSFRAGLEERGQSLFLTPGIDEDLVEEAHAMDLPLTPFADVHTDTNCIIILPSLPHIDPSDPNPDPAVLATFEHVRTLREEAVRVVQRRGAGLVLGEEWLATCMRYDLLFNENGTAIFGPDGIVWELQNIFYPVA